ncbi:MAG: DUF2029 domain-containing protein [Planctomycetota bacterium]|nr:MAG: DUF2029 domain-containing protein [Planctomycetota bacterium]
MNEISREKGTDTTVSAPPPAKFNVAAFARRHPWETIGWFLLVVALCVGSVMSVLRAYHDKGGTDFPEFHAAGRYILEHHDRDPKSILYNYLPSIDAPFALLAWLPMPVAAAVYYVINVGFLFGLMRALYRHVLTDIEPTLRRQAALGAILSVLPLALDGMVLGAFHLAMVWLLVEGLGRIAEGRSTSGGIILGTAVWVKLLPVVAVAYLIWKRRFAPAVIAVVTVIVIDLALSLIAFGPAGTIDTHREWWTQHASATTRRQLTEPGLIDEDRLTNQSLPIVLRRFLTDFGHTPGNPRNLLTIAHLTGRQLTWIYRGWIVIMMISLAWYFRHPYGKMPPERAKGEIGLVALATVWISPVVWGYHPTAAAPALAWIGARRDRFPLFVWPAFVVWFAGMAGHASKVTAAAGSVLWASFVVGLILGRLVHCETRTHDADSVDRETPATDARQATAFDP